MRNRSIGNFQRPELRLGLGDYEWSAPGSVSERDGQTLFLQAVRFCVPSVWEDLKETVYAKFESALNEARTRYGDHVLTDTTSQELQYFFGPEELDPKAEHFLSKYGALLAQDPLAWTRPRRLELDYPTEVEGNYFPYLAALHTSVLEWARRWHLEDEWCFEVAQRTMDRWYESESAKAHLALDLNAAVWSPLLTDDERAFELGFVGWDPSIERREEAEARARITFEMAMKQAFDAAQAASEEQGLRATPVKRQPQHFQWLARYQVQEWNRPQIARYYLNDETLIDTVRDGLRTTAELIGLTLRKPRRGRPPKNK